MRFLVGPFGQFFQPAFPDGSDHQMQASSLASQTQGQLVTPDSHLWGYLQPFSDSSLDHIDFPKECPEYIVSITLPPPCDVSGNSLHRSRFTRENEREPATFQNLSDIFKVHVNHTRILKGECCIFKEGDVISFSTGDLPNSGIYQYCYRDTSVARLSGTLFSRYDTGKVLGSGGFATVLRAVHRKTRRFYAVKRIIRLTQSPSYEIDVMKKLDHPNICKFVDVFFHSDNSINIVMELFEEGSLLNYINELGRVCEEDSRCITYQICTGMAYVHSQGIVHRDLKPENILMASRIPLTIKITDFGIAKAADDLGLLRSANGSEYYVAPEIFSRPDSYQGYNELVDSWSVGAIVLAMLTGENPTKERITPDHEKEGLDVRVSKRQMNLDALVEFGYDIDGKVQQFTRSLLDDNPRERKSLTDARKLPWLVELTDIDEVHDMLLGYVDTDIED